jgi:hypothetical protein
LFIIQLDKTQIKNQENKHKSLVLAPTPPLHYYQLVARRIPAQPTFLAFLKYLPSVEIRNWTLRQLPQTANDTPPSSLRHAPAA